MSWTLKFMKRCQKELPKLKAAGLAENVKQLLEILKMNPYQSPPAYEKLRGELKGAYSRRINLQHRLVYTVDDDLRIVKVLSMWSHYE